MSENQPAFFDTDGRPQPADYASAVAERKLKIWAVLNAVQQGLMDAVEACNAYGISPAELEEQRADWLDFESGRL